MKQKFKNAFAVLFALCLLCTSVLPAFAADDPYVYESSGIYLDGDGNEHPFHTSVTFDPASGRLTIDEDKGNILSIDLVDDFISWIKTVADGVRTVYITKDSYLSHFTNDEHVLAAYPFHRAFAYLSNLESFEVEKGNTELLVKDGVLYSDGCLSLIHYPAAKPDKYYKIEETCMEGLEPYAFCNTRYLETLEFPSARSSMTLFDIEDYSLSSVDLETGEAKETSIRKIIFHASEETFWYYNDFRGTNNVAHQCEVVFDEPSAGTRIADFFSGTVLSYIRMLIRMIRQFFADLSVNF